MTAEFEAACNGEIDIIPAFEVGADLLADLEQWTELGWLLLECGCLVGPQGHAIHGCDSRAVRKHSHTPPKR
jgi:hypothetical protein